MMMEWDFASWRAEGGQWCVCGGGGGSVEIREKCLVNQFIHLNNCTKILKHLSVDIFLLKNMIHLKSNTRGQWEKQNKGYEVDNSIFYQC